jgi:hypothetical protein
MTSIHLVTSPLSCRRWQMTIFLICFATLAKHMTTAKCFGQGIAKDLANIDGARRVRGKLYTWMIAG